MQNNKHTQANRIMARDEFASNDTWKTGLNNNDLIIGSTGAGKTRNYVKPNLMQCNESVIVTDTKGNLVREVGPLLARHGYRVVHIDFTNVGAKGGIGYNPLDFIRVSKKGKPDEQDIMRVAKALCPIEDPQQAFWEYSAEMYIACLIGYVMECLPRNEHTLEYVLELVSELGTGVTAQLMEELCDIAPDSFAATKWRSFSATEKADKMYSSIIGVVAEKLNPLMFSGTKRIFSRKERIDFKSLGQRKTALFLTVSDTDRSMDRIVSLFYTQALNELCRFADNHCEGSALPMPVRLYLDDFATNCRIEDFDKIISVIRSRNISVSVILQSITQLDAIYTHPQAMTIVNGCDHIVYLGGQDVETAEVIAQKADVTTGSVLNQPVGKVWLFERGQGGKEVELFRLEEHERYDELPEAKARKSSKPSNDRSPELQ